MELKTSVMGAHSDGRPFTLHLMTTVCSHLFAEKQPLNSH